jgi:hypothetical protein
MIDRGDFPRQFQLGRRAVGWIADDIIDWIQARADSQSSDGFSGTVRNVGTTSESMNTSSWQS